MAGGIASHIFNLGTRWRKVVSFTNTNISDSKCVVLYVNCDLCTVATNVKNFSLALQMWKVVGN